MKNLSLLFISIFALVTFSCQREEVLQNGGLVSITATQQSSPDLKTNIGAPGIFAVTWNATDHLGVFNGTAGFIGNDQSTNNSTGFTALPGGLSNDGGFTAPGNEAYIWSISESDTWRAYYLVLYSSDGGVYLDSSSKNRGRSVRCLRDN